MAKIWTYNDFVSKEDFFKKVRNKTIKEGDHFKGKVVSILSNNAGVLVAISPDTIPGYKYREFSGMIPIKEIDRESFENIEDIVNVGDELEVEILNFDLDREYVILSRKALMPPIENYVHSSSSFTTIDNSNIIVEGEKKLYIHPINDMDDKRKKQVDIFKQYVKDLEQKIGKGKILGEKEIDKAKYIINKIFKVGFSHKVFISNKSFMKNDRPIKKIAIRVPRVPGDIIDTEFNIPISENIVFEGVILYGKEIAINKIFIVAEEEKLPYEVECKFEICNNSLEIKETFLDEILDKMKSVYEYTETRLKAWEYYLKWKKTIAELQIKGCKYIDVNFDSEKKKLIFTLISKNKEEFEKIKKSLRNVKVYGNSYSKNEWEFIFDKEDDRRNYNYKFEDLGLRDKTIVDEFYLFNNEDKVLENNNEISIEDIKEYFGDKNPYISKMAYDFSDNDKDYIQDQNLEGEDLEEYVQKEVLPRYPKSGFLAVSAVGEFSLIGRLNRAIKQLKEGQHFSPRLTEWLFDTKYAREPEAKDIENVKKLDLKWYNKNIESDKFQKEAIIKMLQAPDLFLLQGPPETGKTTVIVEAICQFVKQNKRVLLASQSNDAVDNAFERLAKINNLETRALRIGNRKNKKYKTLDEEATLKYSEDTALKSYYESISSKISEKYLNEWKNHEEKATTYILDLRDLKNYDKDILEKQQQLEIKNKELSDLIKDLEKARQKLQIFNEKYENIQKESSQYNNFSLTLNGVPGNYFFLSEKQLSIIENDINQVTNKLTDLGIKVSSKKNPINKDNLKESNDYLFSMCSNFRKMIELEKELNENFSSIDNEISNEIVILDQKIKDLDEKLNVCSDDEYEKLEQELNKLRKERRNKTKAKAKDIRIFNLVDQSMLNVDNNKLLQLINDSNKEIETLISTIKQKLEEDIKKNKNIENPTEVKNNVNKVDNKIKSKQEEIKDLNFEIQTKRNTINNLCNKYNSSAGEVENKINDLHRQNLEKIDEDKIFEKSFGDTLKKFKNKLDKHISNDKLMQMDNDNYFKNIYVKHSELKEMKNDSINKLLDELDILIDGPFIKEQIDTERNWIGSKNQTVYFLSNFYKSGIEFQNNEHKIEVLVSEKDLLMNGWPFILKE